MKIFLLALGLPFVCLSQSVAWEIPKNPDRFPSVAMYYQGLSYDTDYGINSHLGVHKQEGDTSQYTIITELLLPITSRISISACIGIINISSTTGDVEAIYYDGFYMRPGGYSQNSADSKGQTYRLGIKYYINY